MKRLFCLMLVLCLLLAGCGKSETTVPEETIPETTAATVPETTATVPTTSETFAPSTPQEVVGEPTYIANTNTKKF